MTKRVAWLVVSGMMVLSLVLASCAKAAPTETTTAPTAPITPTAPAVTEKEVTAEKGVTAEKPGMVQLRLTKFDGTVVEKWVEAPKYGGVFRIARKPAATGFDAAIIATATWWPMWQAGNELVTGDWYRGPSGTNEVGYYWYPVGWEWIVGSLAESWEFTGPDSVVFHMRRGVRFSLDPNNEASRLVNGREVDAYDAEFVINRALTAGGPYYPVSYNILISAKALDQWTFEMKFKPGQMGRGISAYADHIDIIPREVVEKYGNMNNWRNVVGTGPFILVDYVSESSMTFRRNLNYWEKDPLHPQNQLPYYDKLQFLIIADDATMMAALRTGQIDWMMNVPWEEATYLRKTNPELKYTSYVNMDNPVVWLRVDKPELPTYDIRVRRALNMAVNKQEMADQLYGGRAKVYTWPVSATQEFSAAFVPFDELPESVRELYEYQPDRARQLLAEAGHSKGFKIKVLNDGTYVDLLSIIKADWAKVGVELVIDIRETAVTRNMEMRHTFDDAVMNASRSTIPFRMVHWLYYGAQQNYSGVDDERLTKASEAMSAAWFTDIPERNRVMRETVPYMLGQSYAVPTPAYEVSTFWQPWVKGYNGEYAVGFVSSYSFSRYIWIDQDLKEAMTGRR